jgi:hypothetical protein
VNVGRSGREMTKLVSSRSRGRVGTIDLLVRGEGMPYRQEGEEHEQDVERV